MPAHRPLLAGLCSSLLLLAACAGDTARSQETTPAPAGTTRTAPAATPKSASTSPYDKPGFITGVKDGRLWVFDAASKDGAAYRASGTYPAKHVVRPGAGPGGMTVRSPDTDTILRYMGTKPGFIIGVKEGRLWVFRAGSPEAAAYQQDGKYPAKHVVRPGAGPLGATLRSPDTAIILEYLGTKPGFAVYEHDGRLWVYQIGSKEHEAYLASKKHPAKHIVRPGVGPGGVTLRGPDAEIINAYIAAQEGFVTGIKDGRIWVFRAGTKEADAYLASGKYPAKHVVRPGGGPAGMTVRSPEAETIDAYRRAAGLN